MITYNKLVRDKIPQIIETKGKKAKVRVLDELEYKKMLDAKLQEELDEYIAADEKDQVEELADLVELVYATLEHRGITVEQFEKIRIAKQEKRGRFKERLFLISVEENDKEIIFKEFNSKEEQVAREIDKYITGNLDGITIKSSITDCIGYKIGESKKFASITIQDKHSLILHIGLKREGLGIKLQEDINTLIGTKFQRTKTDNQKYPHQAYIKLEWVKDIEQIKPFIIMAYECRSGKNSSKGH
ncbi:hypothetical protein BK127_26675 [Paenibacillus sp. FSL H7-0331]|nr:hypothetical protein BK127_26675 [Paenibacillus sp. FSL H7-0331]